MKQVVQVWENGYIVDRIMEVKWNMETIYEVRVDGRLFEDTQNKERADELMVLLPKFYPNSKITTTAKKKRKYIERKYL